MKTIYSDKNSYTQLESINMAARNNPAEFVERCERDFEAQLDRLALDFDETLGKKILMLSGPSSSGKTTTAFKIKERFERLGHEAHVVSLDEFFLGAEQYPKLPNGMPDMESVHALDVPLIRACLSGLLESGRAMFPRFDFATSSRLEQYNEIVLRPGGLLIIEGIHALNPILTESLDASALYKAYISTRTRVLDGDEPVYAPKDARLVRRMVRDQNFRGYPAMQTLLKWNSVLEGEYKYIYPYRDNVDFKIDSSLEYEGCVFRHFLKSAVGEPEAGNPQYEELSRLSECLSGFVEISNDLIPKSSLLCEFIAL